MSAWPVEDESVDCCKHAHPGLSLPYVACFRRVLKERRFRRRGVELGSTKVQIRGAGFEDVETYSCSRQSLASVCDTLALQTIYEELLSKMATKPQPSWPPVLHGDPTPRGIISFFCSGL